ncbi:MAG: hypothetical protein HDR00_10740 [Lachnospiraceae bacterium]|nr:hypothetical protein [Lachnospiraceae bacterium]
MIKRRIVSVFIVLLFVLIITMPVFSSAAKEESTVPEGRVKGICIGKGQVFQSIGNIRENLDKAMDELLYEEDLLAYWRVLNNQQPFVSTNEDGQEFYWDEYDWWLGRRQVEYRRADKFMLVDMDGDGGNEVVLYCWPESTQVLHYEDGVVYSYQFVFRGMKRIHKNGIYEGANGASNTCYLRLTELNKEDYTEETIAVMDYYGDYFEVEGAEVSFEEYCDYAQEIESVELAETMEFTEDMLADCLLGDS